MCVYPSATCNRPHALPSMRDDGGMLDTVSTLESSHVGARAHTQQRAGMNHVSLSLSPSPAPSPSHPAEHARSHPTSSSFTPPRTARAPSPSPPRDNEISRSGSPRDNEISRSGSPRDNEISRSGSPRDNEISGSGSFQLAGVEFRHRARRACTCDRGRAPQSQLQVDPPTGPERGRST